MLEARVEWPLWSEAIDRNGSTTDGRAGKQSVAVHISTMAPKGSGYS